MGVSRSWATRSWAPSAASETRTAAVYHRRWAAVHRSSLVGAPSQVRGDVGGTLAVEAVALGSVLGVVQVQTTHVELLSHDDVAVGEQADKGVLVGLSEVFGRIESIGFCVSAGSAVSGQAKEETSSNETRKSRQKRA